jgi:hypothetical protein
MISYRNDNAYNYSLGTPLSYISKFSGLVVYVEQTLLYLPSFGSSWIELIELPLEMMFLTYLKNIFAAESIKNRLKRVEKLYYYSNRLFYFFPLYNDTNKKTHAA